jgi:xylan 1,4-beta-xylosidase
LDDNGVYSEDKFGNSSYNAFALLHELGDERIASPSHDVLVTRRKDGALVVAAWNLVDPDKKAPRLICTWNSRVSTRTRRSP